MIRLTLDEVFELSKQAVMGCGASEVNASSLALSVREAEADGIRNVGLGFMPFYCQHLLTGAIDGKAEPAVFDQGPAAVMVDAKNGFAHPAFDCAEAELYEKARTCGMAALSVRNAYYNGVVGYFVKRMAEQGLIGFVCTNAVAMVSPHGGKKPMFGTNPLAFGVPRNKKPPLVIDLSTSTTAFVNVAVAAANGEKIPDTWALDKDGCPTTDPNQGLEGTLQPLGGPKGTGLGLMVEILAAGLSGADWSFEVPAFTNEMDQPPKLGQFYMAIDPGRFGNTNLPLRLEAMLEEMLSQEGVRLPGGRRETTRQKVISEGVELDNSLHHTLLKYASNP